MSGPYSDLIIIAAEMARGLHSPFDLHGFYQSTPKSERRRVLDEITRRDDKCREWAIRIRQAADALRAASNSDQAVSEA